MIRNTVFHRLTAENEDSITELLANLMQNKTTRDVILSVLLPDAGKTILDSITNESIVTQKVMGSCGKPDLVINSAMACIVLENKIKTSTALQQHEIEDYIKLVDKSGKNYKRLVFLIPKGYIFEPAISKLKNNNPEVVKTKYWQDFMIQIEDAELDLISPVFAEALKYTEMVVSGHRTQQIDSFSPLGVAMLYTPSDFFVAQEAFSLIYKKLFEADNMLIPRLNELGLGSFWHGDFFPDTVVYGKYVTIQNKSFLYYGFYKPKDQIDEKYTFSVAFKEDIELKLHYSIDKTGMYRDEEGWYYLPLDRRNLLLDSTAKLVDEIVDSIKNHLTKY